MRPIYYKVYDQGRPMGTYTATELRTMIHCGRNIPRDFAADCKRYRGKYTFVLVDNGKTMTARELAEEWDKERLRILRKAGKTT